MPGAALSVTEPQGLWPSDRNCRVQLAGDPGVRVHGMAADPHLEVQVAAGDVAGRSHGPDVLARLHRLTHAHGDPGEVGVERGHAVAVLDEHHKAVAAVA